MSNDEQIQLADVLKYLDKHGLKASLNQLVTESNLQNGTGRAQQKQSLSQLVSVYESSNNPLLYETVYSSLLEFIEDSLESHRCELSLLLFPVFMHMYLELIYNGHGQAALNFYSKFRETQESHYGEYLDRLAIVTHKEHMLCNDFLTTFRASKFVVTMSRETYSRLRRYLQENHLNLLLTIVQDKLDLNAFDGAPRSKQQIESTAGGLGGEASKDANKVKVLYGLLKEPDINIPLDEEDEAEEEKDKPKKKKAKKDPLLLKKSKNDPNAPSVTRIPLPEMKDSDKLERISYHKESAKRLKVGPNTIPSVCFYTLLNSQDGLTCSAFSDDSLLLAAGFESSTIKVWSLTPQPLMRMKNADELNHTIKESDDILMRMLDDSSASEIKVLNGHGGIVYGVDISHDKNFIVSCSEDSTVRLWSLLTWANIVTYRGHSAAVWGVQFSPQGHYFVSCSQDKIAYLWSMDHHSPRRMFVGHLSDVDCVQFHHNCNYVVTGSGDRSIRMWDVSNGACVRTMTGHKGTVNCLAFSPDGRYLASGSADKNIHVYDISTGYLVACLTGHTKTVHTIAYSREGTILASGGLDNTIKLWDMGPLYEDKEKEIGQPLHTIPVGETGCFSTKHTPVHTLHFTRRNLLLAAGNFQEQ